jgi:predicted acyltransferase
MALVAVHPRQWVWSFVDTLTQIGLAYPFVFVVARRPKRDWFIALAGILGGYWLWFALTPVPPVDFDFVRAGVSQEWLKANGLHGFLSHWQKNANPAAAFDRWFINLFPVDAPHTGYQSGLTTLNFIPSIATMIIGVIAGDVLRSSRGRWDKVRWLSISGILLVGAGSMLGLLGVCPIVKAIWTPSWVLFSGGWCLLFLAGFSALVDSGRFTRLVFPLTVIGMNSIVAYGLSHVYPALAFNSIRRVTGSGLFQLLGQAYEPVLYGCAVFLLYWLTLFFLYRQRIFIRI